MVSILVTMWPQDVLSKAFDLAGVAGMPSSRSSLKCHDPSVQAHAFCSNVVSGIYAFFWVCREKLLRALRPENFGPWKGSISKVLGFCACGGRSPTPDGKCHKFCPFFGLLP